MGYKNREIEVKLLVDSDKGFNEINRRVVDFVESIYPEYSTVVGKSYDLYWNPPKGSKPDFVRLRRSDGRGAVITVKESDKGNNTDRVEIDLDVDNYDQSLELLSSLHGEPKKLSKKYYVYFLENSDTNISVYQVSGDSRVFIEVEGRSLRRVKKLCSGLNKMFSVGLVARLIKVNSSLFDIFVMEKSAKLSNIYSFLKG